jgi:hypothetical protein
MSFQVHGLSPADFAHLFDLDDAGLQARRARRVIADGQLPCRVTLRDSEPGDVLILANYEHQPADTPYRASHAVFVGQHAEAASFAPGEVPEQLRRRILSLRAFDADGMLLTADLADGPALEEAFEAMFADPAVAYIHAHFAKHGCYAARIERA